MDKECIEGCFGQFVHAGVDQVGGQCPHEANFRAGKKEKESGCQSASV